MTENIFDYSTFYSNSERSSRGGGYRLSHKLGLVSECPFCRKSMHQIRNLNELEKEFGWYSKYKESQLKKPEMFRQRILTFDIYECASCGFWQSDYFSKDNDDSWEELDEVTTSQLRKFDIASNTTPVEVLSKYINKNRNLIYSIHHSKMEELVQSVFSSFFDCKAIHCGRSGDGGIDIILLEADTPTAIQVKRRTRNDKVEPVSTIREFLGAMALENFEKGIVVTTAGNFTRGARDTARKIIDNGHAKLFELYNMGAFIDVFKSTRPREDKPFVEFLDYLLNNRQ